MTAVGSTYTLSSEWLTIGSAVASSSAVITTGLRLVGRVSTFKPTGWLVISAIVLGLLGEMLKGLELDLSRLVPTFTPWFGEGSTFTYNNQNYYIAPTRGDGACGAHALLGSKVNGMYEFAGDVREHYVKTLNEKLKDSLFKNRWEEVMICLLKDRLRPVPGEYSKFVFSDQDIVTLRRDLANLENQTKNAKIEQKQLLLQASRLEEVFNLLKDERRATAKRNGLSEKALLSELDKRDPEFISRKTLEINENIIPVVKGVDQRLWHSLSVNKSLLKDLETKKEGSYRSCVRKESVRNSYTVGVLQAEYYFSTQELGLMAHIFDKHVMVLMRNQDGTFWTSIDEGDLNPDLVTIFHQGAHYSRCEPVVSEQPVN